MTINYSAKFGYILPVEGTEDDLWGPYVNDNFAVLTEQALDGYATVAVPDANVTLTTTVAVSNQARNRALRFTGSLTLTREIILPATSRLYLMWNATNGSLTYKTAAGAGVTFPAGSRAWVFCDGTDTVEASIYARLTGGTISGFDNIATSASGDFLRGTASILDYSRRSITADYTLVDGDRKRLLYKSGGTATVTTIPTNATTAFPLGTLVYLAVADGAAATTVTPAGGVTLRTAGTIVTGAVSVTARQVVQLLKVDTDEWWLIPTPGATGGGGAGALLAANNLSDLTSAAAARTNLALGTAAQQNVGTSGATLGLLNTANTHTDARGVAAAPTSNLQLGFRRLRPASVTTGTPTSADSDSCIYATDVVTLPQGVFQQGDTLLIYNTTGAPIAINQGLGLTLRLDGTASTGNRTLAARGRAAVLYVGTAEAVIGGAIS